MTRSALITRSALGLTVLLAAVACSFTITTTSTKPIEVNAQGSSIDKVQDIDLSTVSEIKDHAKNIESIDLQKAKISVASISTDNTWPKISGSLKLRPFGATNGDHDVLVATLTDFDITAGNSVTVNGSPALNAFVMSVVQGDLKFTVVVTGASSQGVVGHFTLNYEATYSFVYHT